MSTMTPDPFSGESTTQSIIERCLGHRKRVQLHHGAENITSDCNSVCINIGSKTALIYNRQCGLSLIIY